MSLQMRFISLQEAKNKFDSKEKKLNKITMAGINNKFFKEKDVFDKHEMPYKKVILKDERLKIKDTDIGKQVYWSGDTMNKYYELIDIKHSGENGYNDGAYVISKHKKRFPIHCYFDEVILHPNNLKRKYNKRKNTNERKQRKRTK